MNFCSLHKFALILSICCLALIGCNSSEEYTTTPNGDVAVYLSLQINTGVEGTRANLNGGEEGNGTIAGNDNENKIDKLVMLFFDADKAPNGIDDTNVDTPVYKEFCENPILINQSGNAANWTTRPIELKSLLAGKEYYMVVIANAYHFQFNDITKLGELQEFVISGDLWKTGATIEANSGFVMTSRFKSNTEMGQALVTLNDGNTYDNPAVATAYLERLAARVDIIPKVAYVKPETGDGYYEYPITLESGTSEDKIRLYGIQLINKYNQGSYLLKHIADADASNKYIDYSSIKRIGTELLTNPSGSQTNYVVDPNTKNKTGTKQSTWYDNYYNTTFDWKPVVEKTIGDYFILDYTRENTMSRQFYLDRHYITALNLKCVYVPKGFIAGQTFYEYAGYLLQTEQEVADKIGGGITAEDAVKRGDVITYPDGKCYYTYYIRHSEDGTDDGVMKYGLVRNNIYCITINSFKGLGSEDRNDPIPITKNVDFTINVVRWNVIKNEDIIL